jgi:hypothetical protein
MNIHPRSPNINNALPSTTVGEGSSATSAPRPYLVLAQVLIAATVLLLPVGVLGMFSIGFPLFVGGLLTLVSACDSAVPYRTDHRPPQ